jgi:hypothetical protein
LKQWEPACRCSLQQLEENCAKVSLLTRARLSAVSQFAAKEQDGFGLPNPLRHLWCFRFSTGLSVGSEAP